MMKQGKMKNLIQLMNKIHSQKKQQLIVIQQPPEEIHQFQHRQVDNEEGSADSMSYIRNKTTWEDNIKEVNNSNQVGIFFTQDAIKPRFDQKKTLYQIYRDSLERKKSHLNHLLTTKNKKSEKTVQSEDQMRYTKQIYFPIRQNNKIKQRRESQNYQKFKKKSLIKEHLSIPFLPHQTHSRTRNKKAKLIEDLDDKLNSYQQMRNKRLDYKPMFRVKRIALQTYKTQATDQEESNKLQKYSFYKKIMKVQQTQYDKNTYLREKINDKKRTSKILLNKIDRFSAWDSGAIQKTQENQLVAKLY